MEDYHKKDVGKALTTDEIRLQAHKWTLAGDVGLLAHLEQFSQNLLNQSQETKKNLNALLDSVEDTSTTINNVTNQFLALQNSQFVENCVCDDESPTEELKSEIKISREEHENLFLAEYKEAVEIGVKLLDSHFEEVQLPPNSDSDEEEDTSVENSGLVWKPKNPYAGKRFPLLIGSTEWWADDNVGLGEYEENINSDLMSPESESDTEAEDSTKKRIRISLSTSIESEKRLKEKLNIQNDFDVDDDIFVPIGKDMFSVQSNFLERKDGYEGINRPSTLHIEKSSIKSSNSLNISHENHEIGDMTDPSKRTNTFLFNKNDENNEINEPSSSMIEQNKFQNAFTKELTAKLSSVVNKNGDYSKAKNVFQEKENKDPSALFDKNDNGDNLFSARNSVPDALFKKDFIFSDGDAYDPLFGNSENLFSESMKGPTLRKSVKINSPKESIEHSNEENNISKPFNKKIKFSDDDIFGSNDDLFSGKSYGPLQNSRGPIIEQKERREVKFSTPTEQRDDLEVPNADIFGGVSGIKSDNSSTIENVSAISNEMDNSFNFARIVSNETSKDDGFIEPSDMSNSKSGKFPSSESPGLFEPRLSSTRHIISDTSDYKTQRLLSNLESHAKSNSTESHSQNNSKNEVGYVEKTHVSREQSEMTKSKSLFVDDDDEDDDLFHASKSTKSAKERSLFSDMENENLFSNSTPNENKNQSLFDDKNDNVIVFQKSSLALFDGDEARSTGINKLKEQNSVSMSSSRSSLYDDMNVNKSNLATVFNKDKLLKSSDNLFSVQDDNLFVKKVSSIEDSKKVFDDNSCRKSIKKESKNLSLFEDIGDVDDLFENVKFTRSVKDFEEDADLFEKHSYVTEKLSKNVKKIEDNEIKINAKSNKIADKLNIKEKQDIFFSEESQILFGESLDSNIKETDSKVIGKQNTLRDSFVKTNLLSVSDCILFGEVEDKEEDLFRNDKSENRIFIKKIEKTDTSPSKNQNRNITLFDGSLEYDDIFKNISLKGHLTENKLNKELQPGKRHEVTKNVKHSEDSQSSLLINTESSIKEKENISGISNELEKTESLEEDCLNINEARTFSENNFIAKTCENILSAEELVNNIYSDRSFKKSELGDNVEEGIKPSSPNMLRTVTKINLQSKEGCANTETDGLLISTAKTKTVGKLNIPTNLKINPMILLPGATVKKKFSLEKNDGGQEIVENEDNLNMEKPPETSSNLLKCLSKNRVKIQSYRRPQTRRARHEALRSSGIDFQIPSPETTNGTARSKSVDNFEKSLILPSKHKSNSDSNVNNSLMVTNEKETEMKMSEVKESSSPVFYSIENSPDALFSSLLPSNPLSPSTDEEDYFNIPELDINFEREDQSIFNSSEKDFRCDGNLLFNDAPVLSPINLSKDIVSASVRENYEETGKSKLLSMKQEIASEVLKKRTLIYEDSHEEEDDDDTLFKGNEAKSSDISLPIKANVKNNLKDIFDDLDDQNSFFFEDKPGNVFSNKEIPKSLFNDNNDDYEDLFDDKTVTNISSNKITKDSTLKNKINKSNIFEKAKEPFIDPLGLISSKD